MTPYLDAPEACEAFGGRHIDPQVKMNARPKFARSERYSSDGNRLSALHLPRYVPTTCANYRSSYKTGSWFFEASIQVPASMHEPHFAT
jgi:hypothetical protein